MLEKLIRLALGQRLLVLIAALGLAVWGAVSYFKLPIDAFPDVAPAQVLVAMRAPGLTPEELEARVTAPIELAAKGIPHLVRMRSITRYSVALLTFEFEEGTDIYWARVQVNERLALAQDQLPDGVSGGLAPIVTPLGEMLMFTIVGGDLSPSEQRTLFDWTIRPALRGLPGVADLNRLGGFVRTFEVAPSPSAMAARGVTVKMLDSSLRNNNRNDGAGRVRDGEEALLVRAEGRLRSLDDIRSVVIAAHDSGIVRVGDVAEVRYGSLARNGVVVRNGEDEAVWGLVLGLRGADARTVVSGVKAKLAELEPTLPKGARFEIFYDRSELIGKAVWTVQKVLLEAIVLVVVLLALFLGNLRAAIVVSVILPLAALATFGIMRLSGLSANIMSLGGLAIAIGLLVDCAVVVVENVEHRMANAHDATLSDRIFMTSGGDERGRNAACLWRYHHRHRLPSVALARRVGRSFVFARRAHHRIRPRLCARPVANRGASAERHAAQARSFRRALARAQDRRDLRALAPARALEAVVGRRHRLLRPYCRRRRLFPHRPDIHAGDGRGNASHHCAQTSNG